MPNNIYRIDHGSTHGWQVRMEHEGRWLGRLFSDRKHGGRENAHSMATSYRDALRESIGRYSPKTEQIQTRESRRKCWEKQTRTGVPGIGYTYSQRQSGLVLFVQGHWREPDGTWKNVKRSTEKHGLEPALDEICRFVARGLQNGLSFGGRKRHLTAKALFNAALPKIRAAAEGRRAAA